MIFTELRLALHGAVAAQAEEHGPRHVVAFGREIVVRVEAQEGHVVLDADDESLLGLGLRQFVVHGRHVGRREFLRAQAVAAADDLRQRTVPTLGHRRDDVLVERLAVGARLFRAIQHGDLLDALGNRRQQGGLVQGTEEMHLDQADLLAAGAEIIDRLFDHAAAGTHADDHALGVGGADVVEEVILPAEQPGELVHRLLHDARAGVVELVAGLAGLEEDVGVLGRAAELGILGRKGPAAVGGDQIHVDHLRPLARRSTARSCSLRARCGNRRRSAGTAGGPRASPRGRSGPGPGPPGPNPRRASPSRCCGRPSRRYGRRRWRGRAWPRCGR